MKSGFENKEGCLKILKELQWPEGKVSCPVCGNRVVAIYNDTYWRCRNLKNGCKDTRFSITSHTPLAGCHQIYEWFEIGFWVIHGSPKPSKLKVVQRYEISGAQALKILQVWRHAVIELGGRIELNAINDPRGAFIKALSYLLQNDYRNIELKKEPRSKPKVKFSSKFKKPEHKETRRERKRRLENRRMERRSRGLL